MPNRPPTHRPRLSAQTAAPDRRQAERERKAALDAQRPSAKRRGYDAAWAKVRAQQLVEFPLCSAMGAPGCRKWATVADHIQTIKERPDLRLDRRNLRSFCKPCHDRHTALHQGFARRR